MKVRVEIDVTPEELRRFLGLPDVAGLQDELVDFLRDKLAADPAGFVLDNLEQLRSSAAVRRLLYGVDGDPENPGKRRQKKTDDQDDESGT